VIYSDNNQLIIIFDDHSQGPDCKLLDIIDLFLVTLLFMFISASGSPHEAVAFQRQNVHIFSWGGAVFNWLFI